MITLSKVKKDGLKIPLRAISIMPFEKSEPAKIPKLAMNKIMRKEATFEPMAELRKFTASLLTPTIKSTPAATISMTIKIK